jgi:hypothetical protein
VTAHKKQNKQVHYFCMNHIIDTSLHGEERFSSDAEFDKLFPAPIRSLSRLHWSPLHVIQKVVAYLAVNNRVKVLDIGSGVGKFCLAGAFYQPAVSFYGVEQRGNLIKHAEAVRSTLGLQNVYFIHKNFTQLDLYEYDHFFFYNAFFENLDGTSKVDDEFVYSNELYNYYSIYLYNQLEKMPVGTRLATYCSWGDEIPPCYRLVEIHFNNLLKFWIKM